MELKIPGTERKIIWKVIVSSDSSRGSNLKMEVIFTYNCDIRCGVKLSVFYLSDNDSKTNEKICLSLYETVEESYCVCEGKPVHVFTHMRMKFMLEVFDQNLLHPYDQSRTRLPQFSRGLTQSLKESHKNGLFTDVKLKLGEKEFSAHKLVLGVQSGFFKARFSEPWIEKDGNIIVDMNDPNDPNLDEELLDKLITAAYTGQVTTEDDASKLLPIANKYEFTKLKEICEDIISSMLTYENVVTYLKLADRHQASALRRNCIIFFSHNSVQIKKTESWEEFMEDAYDDEGYSKLKECLCNALV